VQEDRRFAAKLVMNDIDDDPDDLANREDPDPSDMDPDDEPELMPCRAAGR